MPVEEKKQVELLLMEYFRSCYPDFPKGRLSPSESPDFVLKITAKTTIGIELTRLYAAGQKGAPPETAVSEMQETLIDYVKNLVQVSNHPCLFLKFRFNGVKPIAATHLLSISVKVAQVIRKQLPENNRGFFFRKIAGSQLPDEISAVLIIHHPMLRHSVWESTNQAGPADNLTDDLRFSIHKKDEKFKIYQHRNFQKYWLLITVDRLYNKQDISQLSSFANYPFRSVFDKVFLFEMMDSQIFQLS